MNRTKSIGIILIVFAIAVIAIFAIVKNRKNNTNYEITDQSSISVTDISFDEETKLYYIKDEETGEIIYASDDKSSQDFEFYKRHPDYRTNPLLPRSTNLSDFIKSGDSE